MEDLDPLDLELFGLLLDFGDLEDFIPFPLEDPLEDPLDPLEELDPFESESCRRPCSADTGVEIASNARIAARSKAIVRVIFIVPDIYCSQEDVLSFLAYEKIMSSVLLCVKKFRLCN